jgi:ribosomal protein S18 acetylase RimI-like enzyme
VKPFFSLFAAYLIYCFSFEASNCYASYAPTEALLKINTVFGEMTVYRPNFEELYQTAPTAKAIFIEAFSTTYTEYHRQSSSKDPIERWLRLRDGLTLQSWLSDVFDQEYDEYLAGDKAFLYLCNSSGVLIGWLSHSPVSENGELYLSQCSLEAGSRNHKVASHAFAKVFKEGCINQLFPEVKEVKLIARKINTIAHHLYSNAGFMIDETIDPGIYGDSYDDRYVGFRLVLN